MDSRPPHGELCAGSVWIAILSSDFSSSLLQATAHENTRSVRIMWACKAGGGGGEAIT